MTGANPAATVADGFRIDSRTYSSSTVREPQPGSVTGLPNTPVSTGPMSAPSGRWQLIHPSSWNSFSPAACCVDSAATTTAGDLFDAMTPGASLGPPVAATTEATPV